MNSQNSSMFLMTCIGQCKVDLKSLSPNISFCVHLVHVVLEMKCQLTDLYMYRHLQVRKWALASCKQLSTSIVQGIVIGHCPFHNF